jgi:hypothetical protein
MDVQCDQCGKKGTGTLGALLLAGWVEKSPDDPAGRRLWMCPACVVTLPSIPRPARKR